jgi:hypothetical protein
VGGHAPISTAMGLPPRPAGGWMILAGGYPTESGLQARNNPVHHLATRARPMRGRPSPY